MRIPFSPSTLLPPSFQPCIVPPALAFDDDDIDTPEPIPAGLALPLRLSIVAVAVAVALGYLRAFPSTEPQPIVLLSAFCLFLKRPVFCLVQARLMKPWAPALPQDEQPS